MASGDGLVFHVKPLFRGGVGGRTSLWSTTKRWCPLLRIRGNACARSRSPYRRDVRVAPCLDVLRPGKCLASGSRAVKLFATRRLGSRFSGFRSPGSALRDMGASLRIGSARCRRRQRRSSCLTMSSDRARLWSSGREWVRGVLHANSDATWWTVARGMTGIAIRCVLNGDGCVRARCTTQSSGHSPGQCATRDAVASESGGRAAVPRNWV